MLSKRKQKKLESIRRRIALLTAKIEHAEAERTSLHAQAGRLCAEIMIDRIPENQRGALFDGLRPTNEVARVPVGDER